VVLYHVRVSVMRCPAVPEVEIIENTPLKKGDYQVVLGFAGAGFIGNTAAMFVVRSRGLPQVAHVRSNHIPPMTLITNGDPMPSFRVHLDEPGGILLVITENLIPADGCWPIAQALLKWLREHGAREIYALDGLPFSATSPEIKVLGYGNKIDIGKLGIPPIREGALSGLDSCLLEECTEKGVPFANLFFPTNKLTSIDYGGSADAVDTLNRLFKFGVDPSPLRLNEDAQRRAAEQRQPGQGLFRKN